MGKVGPTYKVGLRTAKIMGKFKEKVMKNYSVQRTYCTCHPETCGCDDREVVDKSGDKVCSFFHKSEADNLADTLNRCQCDVICNLGQQTRKHSSFVWLQFTL